MSQKYALLRNKFVIFFSTFQLVVVRVPALSAIALRQNNTKQHAGCTGIRKTFQCVCCPLSYWERSWFDVAAISPTAHGIVDAEGYRNAFLYALHASVRRSGVNEIESVVPHQDADGYGLWHSRMKNNMLYCRTSFSDFLLDIITFCDSASSAASKQLCPLQPTHIMFRHGVF